MAMYGMRKMSPAALLTGIFLLAIVIIPVFIYLPQYMKEEALLRDFPEKISSYLLNAEYEKADNQVAKAESELGKTPNNLSPLRAVTRLHLMAINLSTSNSIAPDKLAEIKENLQKFRPVVNGYKYYRELVQCGDKLLKTMEESVEILGLIDKNALQQARVSSDKLWTKCLSLGDARNISLFVTFWLKRKIVLATSSFSDNEDLKALAKEAAEKYKGTVIKHLEILSKEL